MTVQHGQRSLTTPVRQSGGWLTVHPNHVGALLAGGLAFTLYARTVTFGFMGDDPSGFFRWIEQVPLTQWFTRSPGFFFRPLVLVVYKLLWVILGGYSAPGFHVPLILLHVANALLVGFLGSRLSGRPAYGWIAALLFATFPLSHEAVAIVDSLAHPLLTFWILLALLLFDQGRRTGDRRYLWAVYPVEMLALLTHENGLILPFLILLLELLYYPPRSVRELTRSPALGTLILPILFLLWWQQIPKDTTSPPRTLADLLHNTLPFLQVTAYPLLPFFHLKVTNVAGLLALVGIALAVNFVAARLLGALRLWTFAVAWMASAAAPAVLFLDWDYLHGSAHIYYLASVGAALLWAALPVAVAGLVKQPGADRALAAGSAALLTLALALPPIPFIRCHLDLNDQATRLVRAVSAQAADAPPDRPLVFANLPIYFISSAEHPQGCLAVYPFVTTGVVVFPPYASLSDFIRVNGGPDRQARGVTVAEYDSNWPPRYGDALPLSDMRETLRQNEVVAFEIDNWSLRDLSAIWQPGSTEAARAPLASFGDVLRLEQADVQQRDSNLIVTLLWRVTDTLQHPVTAFTHVYDGQGKLLAQHDGPPGQNGAPVNYVPSELWQPGDTIRDVHTISLTAPLPSDGYVVAAGLYDPDTQERLPVRDRDGVRLADDLYRVNR